MAKQAPAWLTAPTIELDSSSQSMSMQGAQAPITTLNAAFTGYRWAPAGGNQPTDTYLLVDLTNTSVSPGRMSVNKSDKKGFFTESIHVRMWIDPNADGSEPFLIAADAPASAAEGGSVSNSTSFTLSGGFFDAVGTGSGTYSMSSSVSQTVPDFETVNNTGATGRKIADHLYQLRLVSGARYTQPASVVDGSGSGSIRDLPPRATSDFPVISSAMFHTDSVVEGVRRLHVEVTHRMMMVEKTYQLPTIGHRPVHYDPSRADSAQTFDGSAGLGLLRIDSTPNIRTYTWAFDVDFSGRNVYPV